jgi:hypothetical protein
VDAVALQTIREEMLDDCRVARDALEKAIQRFERNDEVGFEACAHHLCRLYNAFEQLGLRVAKTFENNIDDEQGWHSALLSRLALDIAGIRPALIPHELKPPLQELKAFRHVFVHAYELTLDPQKLVLLLGYARRVGERFPVLVEEFVRAVARQQQIELS